TTSLIASDPRASARSSRTSKRSRASALRPSPTTSTGSGPPLTSWSAAKASARSDNECPSAPLSAATGTSAEPSPQPGGCAAPAALSIEDSFGHLVGPSVRPSGQRCFLCEGSREPYATQGRKQDVQRPNAEERGRPRTGRRRQRRECYGP